MTNYSIGIDLGTTNSVSSIYRNGKIEIIPNKLGNNIMPSTVAFLSENCKIIGEQARRQNGKHVISNVKRMIGLPFNHPSVQADIQNFQFDVEDIGGNPSIIVHIDETDMDILFSPEEISSYVLSEIKAYSEDYLGGSVTSAVITVPAYFTDSQRKATKTAAKLAGIDVLRILNEPTSAAIAFGIENVKDLKKNVLVIDAGGGTFDVSLLSIEDGIYHVQAIAGDSHLGGEDIDDLLLQYIFDDLKNHKIYKQDLTPKSLSRLKKACEQVKKDLSYSPMSTIDIECLHKGIDYMKTISLGNFNNLVMDIMNKFKSPVEKVFIDANMNKNVVDDIVFVGGTTRIPLFQKTILDMFEDTSVILHKNVNPDEVVAAGAGIQAYLLSENTENDDLDMPLVLDVIPLTIGIETLHGQMVQIIKRNTTIPIKKSKMFSTSDDNQNSVTIKIFEGERPNTANNNLLGEFELSGIENAQRGVPQIKVTFDVDIDGILIVTAIDEGSGINNTVTVKKQGVSEKDISQMLAKAKLYENEDEAYKNIMRLKNIWENMVYDYRSKLEINEDILIDTFNAETFKMLYDVLVEQLELVKNKIENNPNIYSERIEYLEEMFSNVIKHT